MTDFKPDVVPQIEEQLRELLREWALAIAETDRLAASTALQNIATTFEPGAAEEYGIAMEGKTFEEWWE